MAIKIGKPSETGRCEVTRDGVKIGYIKKSTSGAPVLSGRIMVGRRAPSGYSARTVDGQSYHFPTRKAAIEFLAEVAKKAIQQDLMATLSERPCVGACEAPVEDCYAGQWTVHGPHHFEVHLMAWKGGGVELRHCPGKTERTKLQ